MNRAQRRAFERRMKSDGIYISVKNGCLRLRLTGKAVDSFLPSLKSERNGTERNGMEWNGMEWKE